MHPFQLGDVVVCLDDTPLPERIVRIGEPWIKAGRTYLVNGVSSNQNNEHGVVLLEVKHWPPASGWHAWRFRRVYPGSRGAEVHSVRAEELETV